MIYALVFAFGFCIGGAALFVAGVHIGQVEAHRDEQRRRLRAERYRGRPA